jgi:hypothetical protein
LSFVHFSDFIKNFKYFLHEPNSSPLIPLVGNKKQRWHDTEYVLSPGKQPECVMARSVLAYWAVRKLGISGTKVGKRLGLSQSAVSPAAEFKEMNDWFSASFTTCQSIDYRYTIPETHNFIGISLSPLQ